MICYSYTRLEGNNRLDVCNKEHTNMFGTNSCFYCHNRRQQRLLNLWNVELIKVKIMIQVIDSEVEQHVGEAGGPSRGSSSALMTTTRGISLIKASEKTTKENCWYR